MYRFEELWNFQLLDLLNLHETLFFPIANVSPLLSNSMWAYVTRSIVIIIMATHPLLWPTIRTMFTSNRTIFLCQYALFSIRTVAARSIYSSINLFSSWLTPSRRHVRLVYKTAQSIMWKKSVFPWIPGVDIEFIFFARCIFY